jgi:hypothetical protein
MITGSKRKKNACPCERDYPSGPGPGVPGNLAVCTKWPPVDGCSFLCCVSKQAARGFKSGKPELGGAVGLLFVFRGVCSFAWGLVCPLCTISATERVRVVAAAASGFMGLRFSALELSSGSLWFRIRTKYIMDMLSRIRT